SNHPATDSRSAQTIESRSQTALARTAQEEAHLPNHVRAILAPMRESGHPVTTDVSGIMAQSPEKFTSVESPPP
ncbi:MAG TPA: hypothetical protein VGX95_07460, partial [Xanthobacteraceae bacterium]|nr:hypothetical protein [Xanthobacteraceae bacterium]